MAIISRWLNIDVTRQELIDNIFDIADDEKSHGIKGIARITDQNTHINRHQDQSNKELIERIINHNLNSAPIKRKLCVSSFNSDCDINQQIKNGLMDNADVIADWLLSDEKQFLDLTYEAIDENGDPITIGRGFTPTLKEKTTTDITLILNKNRDCVDGFAIRTAYPDIQTDHSTETGFTIDLSLSETYQNATKIKKVFLQSVCASYNPEIRYSEKRDTIVYKINDTANKLQHTISFEHHKCIFRSIKIPEKILVDIPFAKTPKSKTLEYPNEINYEQFLTKYPRAAKNINTTIKILQQLNKPTKETITERHKYANQTINQISNPKNDITFQP